MNRQSRFFILVLFIAIFLTACDTGGDGSAELPTLAEFPTTIAEQPTPTSADRPLALPTFPASWTPTFTIIPSGTPTNTVVPTITVTPSTTITDTPSPTLTLTPLPTQQPGPLIDLLATARFVTLLPDDFRIQSNPETVSTSTVPIIGATATQSSISAPQCSFMPLGRFSLLYNADATLFQQLGCPTGSVPTVNPVPAAVQSFENGQMIWLGEPQPRIYVFFNTGNLYQRYPDTFDSNIDPATTGATPPRQGLIEPRNGFGKVWRNTPSIQQTIGWGTEPELGDQAIVQEFQNGVMISVPTRNQIFILVASNTDPSGGTWRTEAGLF